MITQELLFILEIYVIVIKVPELFIKLKMMIIIIIIISF